MTIQKVIDYVNDIKPHTFSDETLTGWINECEGHIQTEVLCIDISEVVVYEYEKNKDSELIVKAPHDKLYGLYLIAMIDFAHGEYAKYENTMQLYNNALDEFAKWFIRTHSKNDGSYEKRMHGYYLSAYGLAVLHGFVGTEDEWLASLKGEQGIQGVPGVKGEKGDPGLIESVSMSDKNGYVRVNNGSSEYDVPVYDDTELKGKCEEIAGQNTQMTEQITTALKYAGNERAGLSGRISDVENRAGNLERGKEDKANKVRATVEEVFSGRLILEGDEYYDAKSVSDAVCTLLMSLENHIYGDNVRHVTADERKTWNDKADAGELDAIKAIINENTKERHNHDNKALLDTITKEKMEQWDKGGNNEAVTVINNGTNPVITMSNNYEIRCGILENLTLVFAEVPEVFSNYVCFTAGNNFTEVTVVMTLELANIKFKGDDVNSAGEFTPVSGKMYEVAFKKVNVDSDGNSIIVGRVGRVM